MKFAAQRRFTPEQEAEIVRLYATGQHSQHALARMNGCSQGTIARILKDKPDMNVAVLQRRVTELEAVQQHIYHIISTGILHQSSLSKDGLIELLKDAQEASYNAGWNSTTLTGGENE